MWGGVGYLELRLYIPARYPETSGGDYCQESYHWQSAKLPQRVLHWWQPREPLEPPSHVVSQQHRGMCQQKKEEEEEMEGRGVEEQRQKARRRGSQRRVHQQGGCCEAQWRKGAWDWEGGVLRVLQWWWWRVVRVSATHSSFCNWNSDVWGADDVQCSHTLVHCVLLFNSWI